MSGQEARINDALKQLGEEYRLGMVALDEYRSRRRMILESWGERDVTTSPGSKRGGATTQQAPALRSAPAPAVALPAQKKGKAGLIVAVVAVVLIGGAAAFVMSNKAPTAAKPVVAAPAAAPLPAAVAAIKKSADDFLAKNTWDAAPIDAFIAQWQALSPDERARALEEPTFKTLRSELQQNLAAETQLVAADAPPEQRQRLDALTRFTNALGGT